jgi:NAD(P)-dependent dehydrogenase (short-subunit alcohol dehydrogenase family)
VSSTAARLDGQSALVTGGGSSIGLASARHLAQDGASVLIVGRNPDKLRRAAEGLRAHAVAPDRVDWTIADVTTEADIEAAVARATSLPGTFTICVASAGGAMPTPFVDADGATFRAVVDLNLVGLFFTFKHAARAMIQNGTAGSLVAISSTSATTSTPGLAAYCASKAGVDALVRVAADELGSHGIRVNAVRPGLTRREAPSPIFGDATLLEAMIRGTPLGRTGVPDDTAAFVRFLAGADASWVTGQCITIDGGSSLRGRADLSAALPRFAEI